VAGSETRTSSLTIFLAKFVGLYCLAVALAVKARKQSEIGAIKALISDPPLLLAEVFALAAGIAMILGHNIWSGGGAARRHHTLGWLLTIRGAGLLALSPAMVSKLVDDLRYKELFYLYMGATFVLGLYLTYAGFSG
jgi:hypothetical protein